MMSLSIENGNKGRKWEITTILILSGVSQWLQAKSLRQLPYYRVMNC